MLDVFGVADLELGDYDGSELFPVLSDGVPED